MPTLAAGLLAALAWWHDRSDRTATRWQHIWWRRARTSFATSIPVLVGVWFLAVQLMLRAHAWRPHPGPPLGGLPVDLIKTIPVEPVYFWAFWCSAAVSAASTFAVAYLLLKKESVQPAGQP